MSATFAVAGDWHGNARWATACLLALQEEGIDTLYHLGDFGLWPNGEDYLQQVQTACEQGNLVLRVVLGNHEDYSQTEQMVTGPDGWRYLPNFDLITFAPRAHVWMHDDVRMATLGGAGSIDRLLRTEGTEWWPQEEITDADVAALIAAFCATGWDRADLMLTHDAPIGGSPLQGGRAAWITPDVEHYCRQQRIRLQHAVDEVHPIDLFHGHWHEWREDLIPDDDYPVRITGLACDGLPNNLIAVVCEPHLGVTDRRIII